MAAILDPNILFSQDRPEFINVMHTLASVDR